MDRRITPVDRILLKPLPRMSRQTMRLNGQRSQVAARAKRVPITLAKVGKEKEK